MIEVSHYTFSFYQQNKFTDCCRTMIVHLV